MIATLLILGTVWVGLAAVFILAVATAAQRTPTQPESDLGFVARRVDLTRPADCHRRHHRHAEFLLQ